MSLNYFKNYIGYELTEGEFQDVPHPYVEMYTHVTLKTVQSGTFLGTILFGPLLALSRKDSRNMKGLISKINRCGQVGFGIGLLAGPVMTYQRFLDQTEDAVYDRAYRMRKNRNQIRVDRSYIIGGVLGSMVTTTTLANPLFGELIGSTAGLLSSAYYNNMYLKSKGDQENAKADE